MFAISKSVTGCRHVVARVWKSLHKVVPRSELQELIGRDQLQSLINKGILFKRDRSPLASDLPKAAYGPCQEQVVTFPNRLLEAAWEETLQLKSES